MQQHPHYAATVQHLGGDTTNYVSRDGDVTTARIQVVQRKIGPLKVSWVPRGPVWSNDVTDAQKSDVMANLHSALSDSRFRILMPETATDARIIRNMNYRVLFPEQHFARLDLTTSVSHRLAAQHGKWRNRLRHALNSGTFFRSRPFKPGQDSKLLQLEHAQRRQKGYKALPSQFTLAWAKANHNAAQLFLAEDRAGLVAFVLILVHAPTATYHIGWSNERGRAASCHNLLLWRASNWLAERGIEELDLGLIDPDGAPGLTRFKLGIGAQTHTTGPTMISLPRLSLPKFWNRAA